MSLFTQSSSALESALADWAKLAADVDEQHEILADLANQQAAVDLDVLSGLQESATPVHASLTALDSRVQPLVVAIRKFKAKADEGRANPDQALYGAAMVSKIDAAAAKLAELESSFTPKRDEFTAVYAQLQTRITEAKAKADAEQRAADERARGEAERAAAAKAEADKQRAEQEKQAAAAAAEQAKKDAAAAVAAKAEAARVAKAEADARTASERAAREALLVERRAAEAREAANRSSTPAAAAAAATPAAATPIASDAGKPLLHRCQEHLDAALAELKSHCTPPELTVALQTLLKFVSNVMASPQEPKFRTIRLSNEVFKKRLGDKPGGLAALRAMGFATERHAVPPAGSDRLPNEDYLFLEAKAELWPVLVQSKRALEGAMAANRLLDPQPGAPPAAAANPFGAGPFGAPGASPFGNLASMFGGAGAGGASGAGSNPLANPMGMLQDPFVQQLMSNPQMMQLAMQASASGGAPGPEMQQQLMGHLMSNPGLMSSMMSSPMVQGVMQDPARLQQLLAMRQGLQAQAPGAPGAPPNPFAGMFGAGSPFGAPAAGGVAGGWDPLESTCRHASLSIL